jgi:hypothetical protein
MTVTDAKKIGSRQGLMAAGLGLLIAQMIMTYMISIDRGITDAFLWFTTINFKLPVFIGCLILLTSAYFFGQVAGKAILIKNQNYVLAGPLCGMAVLLVTASLSGLTGFFQEGLGKIGSEDNPFEDYIFKPFYWVALFGWIPAIVVGTFFGWRIKIIGNRYRLSDQIPEPVSKVTKSD